MALEEDHRRFTNKWTLPRFLVQLFSLILTNGLVLALIYPYVSFQPIPLGLPILVSINSPYATIYSSLDILQLELSQPYFPWIVIGTIFFIGAVVGRAFCGWVCPMGSIQDAITTLRNQLRFVSPRTHKTAKKFKYLVLFLTMLISTTLGLALSLGTGSDYRNALGILASGPFTAISPDGTLFGTIPAILRRVSQNLVFILTRPPSIQEVWMELSKVDQFLVLRILVLVGFFGAGWKVPRFWCRYVCPTGALMAIFQRHSFTGIERDPVKCTRCAHCEAKCPMQIKILDLPWGKFNDPECIMCLECVDACSNGSLKPKFP